MIFWLHEKNAGYKEFQIEDALKEGRLTNADYTEIEEQEWTELKRKANAENKTIVNSPSTNRPTLVPSPPPNEEELAMQEIVQLESYLENTNDLSFECMDLGVAMETRYPAEFKKRQEARARIKALREKLNIDNAKEYSIWT